MPTYTIQELDRLILQATQLGFLDDVAHWTSLKTDLVERSGR